MKPRPNIVLIMTDNQSPWTLGCYGNAEIRTPQIDRLAAAGVRFERAFCVNPVCSPNRATLLTGLIPSQHGVHNYLGGEQPDAQMGPEAYCTIREFPNLPETLAGAGYTCGMVGKWHLGDSRRAQLGFDYWFAKPKGHTTTFYDSEMIWDGEVYREPGYITDVITDHAVTFLRQPKDEDLPLFLYVGYNAPYGLDEDMLQGHRNRHTAHYADQRLACFSREPAHPWLKKYRNRIQNETAMRSYASAVSGVDDGVGRILDTLTELGRDDDTLVIFTADHGLCGGHHGMWGMGDHSRPRHMFQENLQVPLIFSQPGALPAGRVCDALVSHYDFLPTMLDHMGIETGSDGPGSSYRGELLGEDAGGGEAVFHEYETDRAVQTRDWKLVLRHPDGPHELYCLADDPGEKVNLYDDPSQAEPRAELERRLRDFFATYADPAYDLCRDGRSKAGRLQ